VRHDTASELQQQLVHWGLHVGSDLLLGEK
jgi:hypothetical protein